MTVGEQRERRVGAGGFWRPGASTVHFCFVGSNFLCCSCVGSKELIFHFDFQSVQNEVFLDEGKMNNFDCCESKLPFCSLMVKLYSFGVILSLLFSIFI